MDTLKTSVVVVLLLAVLYGVYVILNQPESNPQDLAWSGDDPVNVELGTPEEESGDAGQAAEFGQMATPETISEVGSYPPPMTSTADAATATPAAPSLPIPDPTGRATSSIAAPELIVGDSDSDPYSATQSESPAMPEDAVQAVNPVEPLSPTATAGPGELAGDGGSRYGSVDPPIAMPDEYPTASGEVTAAPADAASTLAASGSGDAPASPDPVADTRSVGSSEFEGLMQSVRTKVADGQWYEALMKLTFAYTNFDLTEQEKKQTLELLDPLAGKVIYSQEHLIEPAYQVQTGESLFKIAEEHAVPWQLLANINSLQDPEALQPGTSLKVVRGPFRAEVSLANSEMTLFVNKLYAGRFPISLGNDPAPTPNEYSIRDKQPGRTYYAGDGRTIPIDDPSNPYGRVWLDLGGDVCIHGTSPNGAPGGLGCISLSPIDAGDIYGILSKGSRVLIRR